VTTKRRYLTATQKAVLNSMAQNHGRAVIGWGTRWSSYSPGRVCMFAQGLHCLLHNRWITSRGQNQPGMYAWTTEGRLAHERGWYEPKLYAEPYWTDEKPLPDEETKSDHQDQETSR
jgi:hypothetical protein